MVQLSMKHNGGYRLTIFFSLAQNTKLQNKQIIVIVQVMFCLVISHKHAALGIWKDVKKAKPAGKNRK